MFRVQAAVLFCALLAVPALAGCVDPPVERKVLLQESVEVGAKIYTWADESFTDPGMEGQVRRIRGNPEVPGDIAQLGVRFAGHHKATENSTVTFTLTDPAGNQALFLNGSIGQSDDVGEIFEYWMFERVIPAFPGKWEALMATRGNIAEVDFKVVGIERRETITERGFTVSDASRNVDLRVLLDGYGRTPGLTLVTPNGTELPMTLDESGEQSMDSFKPQKGHYIVRAETTGWAGRVAFQAVQEA